MKLFNIIMLLILIIASVSISFLKNLNFAVIVFAAASLIMAILWQQLKAPDLAITEAAVGAGISTILLVLTLKRINGVKK
nr:hydrogenase subunit MbhD domain-containing protein [Oxobacter pfennigii]